MSALGCRDALRLRTRWIQELLAVAIRELGRRLEANGVAPTAAAISDLTLAELRGAVGQPQPALPARPAWRPGAPLPPVFRLTPSNAVAPAARARAEAVGVPAGGGRAVGVARHALGEEGDPAGTVLVVEHLDPALAAWLPGLGGLVSEAGSALSHLAIVARELGVPTVVAVPEARRRFPPGARLLVDGSSGDVTVLDPPARAPGDSGAPAATLTEARA